MEDTITMDRVTAVLDAAVDLVADLAEEEFSPADALKILTTAICMILQNAEFQMAKTEIAADLTSIIIKIAANEDQANYDSRH